MMIPSYPSYNEEQFNQIEDFGNELRLADGGSDDRDGFQVFTPNFIVNDMLGLIGNEYIFDLSQTILEPTSGDGAFTVKILQNRLKLLIADETYELKSLQAVSTIYSIEMDPKLIETQRSNIYTVMMQHARMHSVKISQGYRHLAKTIIMTNFMWGLTNIIEGFEDKRIVGWHMPIPVMSSRRYSGTPNYLKARPIRFARWSIGPDLIATCEFEDAEFGQSDQQFDIGGLFDE
ncbi:MAG: hypothetical protein K9K93_02490 [Acholeplasmataceae bacterium]|nr:hypothetical protein [Acholeplasmataceae bacterium]